MHAFFQTSSDPRTTFRSYALSANRSMFVNNLQKFDFFTLSTFGWDQDRVMEQWDKGKIAAKYK